MNVQQLEHVVVTLMSTDNTARRAAEEHFHQAKTNPDHLAHGLLTLVKTSQDERVPPFAALLLRKVIIALPDKRHTPAATPNAVPHLSPQADALLRTELLTLVDTEQRRNVRIRVSDAVGQLALKTLGEAAAGWPELFPFMLDATRKANAPVHEAALSIFNTLSDYMADSMKSSHATLHGVFGASLQQQQDMAVRVAAVRALSSFLMALGGASERAPFQDLVPAMLQTVADALRAGMEDQCQEVLEIFVEIAETHTKFLKRHLPDCVNGMIAIASNTELVDSLRHTALEFLLTVAENAPSLARKLPTFCADTVPVALAMMLEVDCDTAEELAEWENEAEEDDDPDPSNYDVGEAALDRLALGLGGKVMMPVLFAQIQEWFISPEWKRRHAALMAISQSGEGCEVQMKRQLELIVSTIVTKFADPHPRVRWAAINTIGQMSTDFGPALQRSLHSSVLPALIAAMDDASSKRVQAHAAAAVINFCEHCERQTLKPYLPELLAKLRALLDRPLRIVQEQAVTAVASVADVAMSDFEPFYDHFLPGLKNLLGASTAKEARMLRGKAMECVSLIGVAVGRDKFSPDAKEIMQLLINVQPASELDPDDPQLSFMLQACARICKCLGDDFKPYLPYVIPPLLQSAQVDPELQVTDADDDDVEEEEGMESIKVDIRGQGKKRITIRTAALEEKATACSMLHSYAADLREAFFPYVQEVSRVLVPLTSFQYMDDVRTASMCAMPELLGSAILAARAGVPGATGDFVRQLFHFMLPPLLEQLKTEPDTETLQCQVDAFSELLGHADGCDEVKLAEAQWRGVTEVLQILLRESIERREERLASQQDDEYDAEELAELGADDETEDAIVQSIVECLTKLFEVYRSAFLPAFSELLLPLLQPMLQPTAVAAHRAAALCVFDDVMEHCIDDGAAGGAPYVSGLFPAFLQYSQDAEPEVRQAAVYGLGVLAQKAPDGVFTAEMQGQAAQALVACCEARGADEGMEAATDNAVAALGWLCKRSEAIGAFGWPRWLQSLPLQTDKDEARRVHSLLVDAVEASNTSLLGASHERLPEILCVFGMVLGTDTLESADGDRVKNLLKQVHAGLPHILQSLPQHPRFATLNDNQRAALEHAISS